MAWPPAYTASLQGRGATTVKWGTDGIMGNGSPNGNGQGGVYGYYTVESIRPTDELEQLYIENGSGLKSTRITLWQGRQVVMTVIDDLNMTPPSANSQIYIIDPMSGDYLYFSVIQNGTNNAAKVQGRREITAEYLTNIEGGGDVPPA